MLLREREERKGGRKSEIGKGNVSPLLELQLISVYHHALISPHGIKGNGRDVARKMRCQGWEVQVRLVHYARLRRGDVGVLNGVMLGSIHAPLNLFLSLLVQNPQECSPPGSVLQDAAQVCTVKA